MHKQISLGNVSGKLMRILFYSRYYDPSLNTNQNYSHTFTQKMKMFIIMVN